VGTDLAFLAVTIVFVARDRGGAGIALAIRPREGDAVVGHLDVHVAVGYRHQHAVARAETHFSPDHRVLAHGSSRVVRTASAWPGSAATCQPGTRVGAGRAGA